MTLVLRDHVSVTESGTDMVLLDERSGRFWQLNATGAGILRLLLDGADASTAAEQLAGRLPATAQQVAEDIGVLVAELLRADLVVRR